MCMRSTPQLPCSYAVVVNYETFYATMKTIAIKELSGDAHMIPRTILIRVHVLLTSQIKLKLAIDPSQQTVEQPKEVQ